MGRYIRPILSLCSGTGGWEKPYREVGEAWYKVVSFTLPENDVRLLDIRNFKRDFGFDLSEVWGILAAPPCTHLARSGARWWKEKGPEALLESMSIVDACMRIIALAQPKWWALENPVGRLWTYLGKPQHTFDPWEYGDPWTKRTCLWGNFSTLIKTPVKPEQGDRTSSIGPTKGRVDRSARRSITPPGFANAFFKANG